MKFTGQIHPETYIEDTGKLQLLVFKGINLLNEVWLQSPHWDREPTKEMLEHEAYLEKRSVEAKEELKEVAAEIYFGLTGTKLPREYR